MRAATVPTALILTILVMCGGCGVDEQASSDDEAAATTSVPSAEDAPPEAPLPDWRQMWDFGDPAATERKFRDLVAQAREQGEAAYESIVATQLARTQGLQKRFDEAHATLDQVEAALAEATEEVRIRYLLERGRTLHSGGRKDECAALFEQAWEVGRAAGLDALSVDAAHMLALVLPDDAALGWSEEAMALCETSEDPRCKGWLGPLYNNTGWTYFEKGDVEAALGLWEKGLAFRREAGQAEPVLIARYTVARAWRALGRLDEALAEQRSIWTDRAAAELQPSGFVAEEIAECLDAQGHADQAAEWFAKAWEHLQSQSWLKDHEPARWQRLLERSGTPDSEPDGD